MGKQNNRSRQDVFVKNPLTVEESATTEVTQLDKTQFVASAHLFNGNAANSLSNPVYTRLTTGSGAYDFNIYNKGLYCADPRIEIPLGNIPNFSHINKFGINDDIDTASTPEDIGLNGGLIVPPTSAQKISAVSDNAADASAGTGARTIRIYGLDSNYTLQNEDITMNGTTPVDSVNNYTRCYRAEVLTSGSSHTNVGTISLKAKTDTTTQVVIGLLQSTGVGNSMTTFFTIPANYKGLIVSTHCDFAPASGSQSAVVCLFQRTNIDTSTASLNALSVFAIFSAGGSSVPRYYNPCLLINEKTDIFFRCLSVSSNNTMLSAGYDLILFNSASE